jgi:hypothetical protein
METPPRFIVSDTAAKLFEAGRQAGIPPFSMVLPIPANKETGR